MINKVLHILLTSRFSFFFSDIFSDTVTLPEFPEVVLYWRKINRKLDLPYSTEATSKHFLAIASHFHNYLLMDKMVYILQ